MTPASVSVVVCTRSRADVLAACLGALREQSLDDGRLEVVVVDNGSSDATPALLAQWQRRRSHHVAVSEPVAGLSRARNRGMQVAGGDVVAFCDDDALAAPAWAAAHLDAHAAPGIGAAGGPVVLTFPDGRPAWAGRALEHWWSALDLGDERAPFPPPHGPYGTNLSVRRSVTLELGGFDVDLGRVGPSLLSSEEADLSARLWAAGHTIVWEPGAVVVHQVTAERLRRRWVLRRGMAQGRTNARRLARLPRAERAAHGRQQLRAALGRTRRGGSGWDELSTRAGHATTAAALAWAQLGQGRP